MTAPDSRDSVERVVAEMRKRAAACSSAATAPIASFLTATADRLQALARGPQQAGGEDGVEVAPLYVELEIEAALGHAGRTSERLMRMAAEAKALLHRAEAAEAALAEARRWLTELSDYIVNERDRQVLPRKAASYQRELDELTAFLTRTAKEPT